MLQRWAVLGGRFGQLATCYWVPAGYVPRFTPPEGSFVNFLAQMTITVLRYRREKSGATTQPKELLQSYLDRDAVVQS